MSYMRDSRVKYPQVRKESNYYSQPLTRSPSLPDQFHWLSEPGDQNTKDFIVKQNEISSQFLDKFPNRNKMKSLIKTWWSYPRELPPFKVNDRYFQLKNDGSTNQFIMYTHTSLDNLPYSSDVFLDPNKVTKDASLFLGKYRFSPNGKYMAYRVNKRGSDWSEIWFRDLDRRKDFKDTLKYVRYSKLAWTRDSKSIFYSAYMDFPGKLDATDTSKLTDHKLYFHRMGTEQSKDIAVFVPKNNLERVCGLVSKSGKYLIVCCSVDFVTNNLLFFQVGDLKDIPQCLVSIPVVEEFEHSFKYVAEWQDGLIFVTNKNAQKYTAVSIKPKSPNEGKWVTVVPYDDNQVLVECRPTYKNFLLLFYLKDVRPLLTLYDLANKKIVKEIDLGLGAITNITSSMDHPDVFFHFSTMADPGTIYRINCSSPYISAAVYKEFKIGNFNPFNYVMKQYYVPSDDGVKFPVCILHKKNISLDSQHPCIVYAYGCFGRISFYEFSLPHFFFVENFDGVYVIANIRGGGELGTKWHEYGRGRNKRKSIDDFLSTVKFCIERKYTNPTLMVAESHTFGGFVIAASINQTPKLFKAGIVRLGLFDILNYTGFVLGHTWVGEFGNIQDEEDLKVMQKISPYHNVVADKTIDYSSILLLAAERDDRIPPYHSYKYIAELQNNLASKNVFLLRIYLGKGFRMERNLTHSIDMNLDVFCFLFQVLKLRFGH